MKVDFFGKCLVNGKIGKKIFYFWLKVVEKIVYAETCYFQRININYFGDLSKKFIL